MNGIIKRLDPPIVHAPNSTLRCCLPPLANNTYTVCLIKADESAILLDRVQHNHVIEFESNAPVVQVLVTPSETLNKIGKWQATSPNIIIYNEADNAMSQLYRLSDGDKNVATFELYKPPDQAVIEAGLLAYKQYKDHALADSILVVGTGTIALLALDQQAHAVSTAFAIGGALGIAFLQQLAVQVDNIDRPAAQKLAGAVRFLSIAVAIGFLDHAFAEQLREQPSLLIWALLGFMSFRLGLVMSETSNKP